MKGKAVKTLRIYGTSDELIEVSGIDGADEFGSMTCRQCQSYGGSMMVSARDRNDDIQIHAIYSGSWSFAISAESGGYDRMPPWPVRRTWGMDCPYSETLEIDVPDDARLVWLGKGKPE
jgi:hypothetical protein